jgi:hypothetical protein
VLTADEIGWLGNTHAASGMACRSMVTKAFWADAARHYAANPLVAFELYTPKTTGLPVFTALRDGG